MKKLVNIREVKPNTDNPRIIKDHKFKKLVKSIKEFPQMLEKRPIVVDENMIVLGGNMRLKALLEAGIQEVWIDVAENWSEEQKKEFIIKDNVGFGEWDWDILANEWETDLLVDWGLDLPDMFGEPEPEAAEDDYEEPDDLRVDIVKGDLIEIGHHRLLCGDSTNSDDVAKLMNGEKADMVLTDPPYNVNYGHNNNHKYKDRSIENDNMDGKNFRDFIQSVVSNIKLFCDGVVYCFGAQGADGRIMFTVLDENLHNSGTIMWLKDRFVLGRSKYHNQYEPCWFGWNKSGDTFTDDRNLSNVFECKRPMKSDLHPTMKPIELLEMPLKHNPKAKSVLDLFLGSGSTMVAAYQLNRKCYGMELDPKYCQVIIDRMQKLDSNLEIKVNGKIYGQN